MDVIHPRRVRQPPRELDGLKSTNHRRDGELKFNEGRIEKNSAVHESFVSAATTSVISEACADVCTANCRHITLMSAATVGCGCCCGDHDCGRRSNWARAPRAFEQFIGRPPAGAWGRRMYRAADRQTPTLAEPVSESVERTCLRGNRFFIFEYATKNIDALPQERKSESSLPREINK